MNANTLTLGSSAPAAPAREKRDSFWKFHRNLGKREALAAFRFLVYMTSVILLYSNWKGDTGFPPARLAWLLSFYLVSVVSTFFVRANRFENQVFLSLIFVSDTLFVTGSIALGGLQDVDLFVIFFITIFISALSQNVQSVFTISGIACVLYGFLQVRSGHDLSLGDTQTLMRFPFLFVAAALSGYLAMESKKNQEEKLHLTEMNRFLADQADASTLKLTEMNRNLKGLLEYHHCVLASLPLGIIVVRKDGTLRTFNGGARQITGFVEAEMAGRSIEDLPANLAPIAEGLRRTLETGKALVQDHLEILSARREGIPVTLETSLLKAGNGEVLGAIAVVRDMTLLRQMETQLLRAERFSALGEMAAGVAHEIKNPLNAILGFSKRLGAKLEDPSLRKYADIIGTEVVRMDGIVNDVLEYSRPDKCHKEPADLNKLMEETAAFLSEKADAGGVRVEKHLAPALPLVPTDIPKVRQVVLNLMINGLQAMAGRTGGVLSIETRLLEGLAPQAGASQGDIFQRLFLKQKMVAVSVTDNGCGIPKENLSKLFHPFFTTKTTGTGLGLSICQKIIASHGGTLEVDSVPGHGSVFTFYLPVEE
ncbi:MAG TPA: ATP-binding protein [bacterium]|nr:ATP-binding protein [bacterium]